MSLLRPHQVELANRLCGILSSGGNAVDLSDTGTGKTYVAAAVASRLRLPTVCVVPKIAETAWRRAAAHFGDEFSIVGYEKLRTGRTAFAKWENTPPPAFTCEEFFVCQCCQRKVEFDDFSPCYCHPAGIHCIITKKQAWDYGKFIWHPAVKLVIFDEIHRCSGLDSLNADMLLGARAPQRRILGLSATAACTPLQLRALGAVLGLHGDKFPRQLPSGKWLKTFPAWARGHGCRYDPKWHGMKWLLSEAKQTEVMRDIRAEIIPARGVRITTAEIPDFPEREIIPELYDIEQTTTINNLYDEMRESIEGLNKRAEHDCDPENHLTKQLRARERIELLKVPIAVELARDDMEKGSSVVIFCNFRSVIEELSERLGCNEIIDGTVTGKRRQQTIEKFQSNTSRLLLVNNKAGGITISLQDLSGDHPRSGLTMPSTSAVEMIQVFGRLPRDGGKSKSIYRVLLVAGTVEENIFRKLRQKHNNIDALNDADLVPDNFSLPVRVDYCTP